MAVLVRCGALQECALWKLFVYKGKILDNEHLFFDIGSSGQGAGFSTSEKRPPLGLPGLMAIMKQL
jgi:hypothetical protein